MSAPPSASGRPRDPDIAGRVLEVTRRHLAAAGYDALSLVAVAQEAGTTRQALYRRWPSKADLATAAIASMAAAQTRPDTDDPYRDLVTELATFHQGVTRPHGLGMVGAMLQDGIDPELRSLYQQRVVAPRRQRLRHILERARADGLIDADGDLDYAVAACTGTLYSLHLAGSRVTRGWPDRTAAMVWRSLGGEPPG